jgi:hypothetical protein
MEATIDVIGLRKRFGAMLALDGMSFYAVVLLVIGGVLLVKGDA